MNPQEWAEGPRPSYFGQLRGVRKDRDPAPVTGATGGPSESGARWAEPLLEATESDEDWLLRKQREAYVRGQFTKSFDVDLRVRQFLALATTLLIAGLCWRYVPLLELALWVALRSYVAGWRMLMTRDHGRRGVLHGAEDGRDRKGHRRQMIVVAAVSGAVLGSSVLLFFGRIPASPQFACWLILAVGVTLTVPSLAFDPPRVSAFANALFATVVGCIVFRILTSHAGLAHDIEHQHYEPWLLAFPVAQWILVLYVAKRVQSGARSKFELEFYRHALIDTLAEKQRQAEEAVRIKNRFIATAAHDMRQPVVALSLYAEHLKIVPADQQLVLPKIIRAAAAVGGLFESLFDLARMDNEQLEPRAQPVEMSEMMLDLRDQFEPVARAKGIELKMRTARHTLNTDPVLMRRMIGNIVSNAIKYTQPGKKVLIAARVRSKHVVFEVWDQGYGMAPGELREIFKEFYKVDGPSENHEGFGLGLSIVARLAHALDTRVTVRSRPGQGTVFRLMMKSS